MGIQADRGALFSLRYATHADCLGDPELRILLLGDCDGNELMMRFRRLLGENQA